MEHNNTFMPWFKSEVWKDSQYSKILMWLANGLKFDVICCTSYEINNCTFYTNCGVSLVAESLQFSTSKD